MIEITDTQGEIISQLNLNENLVPGKDIFGLTSTAMEKMGINRTTFKNNREFLIKNHLIKMVYEKNHVFEKWQYFDLTSWGFLAYLDWMSIKKGGEETIMALRFVPLIAIHGEDLIKLFGKDFFVYVLQYSLDQIDLKPAKIMTVNYKARPIGTDMNVEITIPFLNDELSLSKVTSSDLVENVVAEKFTFLFYHNLLNLRYNHNLIGSFILNLRFGGKKRREIFENLDDEKFLLKFGGKLENASKSLIKIIKGDRLLFELFEKNLREISASIARINKIQNASKF